MSRPLVDQVRAEAARFGSIGFDRFMEIVLYGPDGFYTRGRGAGRSHGDFVTSVELGPLFGALVARSIDREWHALGRPDPFAVVEAGAGAGRLCREILRAAPECSAALRYVLVEISPALRDEQRAHLPIEPPDEALGAFTRHERDEATEPVAGIGPIVTSVAELPVVPLAGVILANELLDNLPIALAECDGERWHEVRIGPDLAEVLAPDFDDPALGIFGTPPAGTRVPVPVGIGDWFAAASRCLPSGSTILVDYCVRADELVARGRDWLRTYRGHERGLDPFADPGEHDITADVVVEHVDAAARAAGFAAPEFTRQADWLRDLGIDELVAAGERTWSERAGVVDLVALEAKSRATQAAALTDQRAESSLGNFTVITTNR